MGEFIGCRNIEEGHELDNNSINSFIFTILFLELIKKKCDITMGTSGLGRCM
jgi:hypothetical protein